MPMRDKVLASEIADITLALKGTDLTTFESQAIKAISGMCATFEKTELTMEDKEDLAQAQNDLDYEQDCDVVSELALAMVGKNPDEIKELLLGLPRLQEEHKTSIAVLKARVGALQSKKAIAGLSEFERLMLGRSNSSGTTGNGSVALDNVVLKVPVSKKGYRFCSISATEFYAFSVEHERHQVTPLFSSTDITLQNILANDTVVQVKSATTARKTIVAFVQGYRGYTGIAAVTSAFNAKFEALNTGGVGRENRLAKPLEQNARDWLLIANTGALPTEKERTD